MLNIASSQPPKTLPSYPLRISRITRLVTFIEESMSISASSDLRRMHRVLYIPELLDMIFGYLSPMSNTVNARICTRWSDIALDVLWKDVDDLHRLFGILAPLREEHKEYEFERVPESADWKRFEKYANRVRRLYYQCDSNPHRALKQTVFDDVARTRTRLEILPNMHTLHWKGPLNLSILLMHSGVKNFVVNLPLNFQINSRSFFHDLSARMPNLTFIDIRSSVPMRIIETEMVNLFSLLPKLQKITFPRYYFTTRIAEALSRLEHLGVIEFQYLEEQGEGDNLDVVPFNPILTEGSFPALWDHSMAVSFDDTAKFFNSSFAPTNLSMLYVDSLIIETPASIYHALSVIADNCQLLKFLALVSLRDASPAFLVENAYNPELMITIDHLKPVLKLPNLGTMELIHQYPLALKLADLELLAASWPSLETLLLNTEPVYLSESHLTLEALLPFARHCPKLKHLGLFLDATFAEPPAHLSSIPQFQSLKRLSMGVSIIPLVDNVVALYLSHIVPLDCRLDCGITWDAGTEVDSSVTLIVQDRCEAWLKVGELLPVLVKLRKEERDRTREMEKELEDLRMRTKVMSDRAALGVKLDITNCVMI